MTLDDTDLEAAIAEGIVTTDQAAALRALAERRERARALSTGHEERFQFMRSFNDFFFAIGIALLGGGLVFFTFGIPLHSLIAAAIVWALAELLVARMRLVLPGILLACLFAAFVLLAAPVDFWFIDAAQTQPGFDALREWATSPRGSLPMRGGDTGTVMIALTTYALVGAGAALLFYVRFRLPFALLLVAGALVCAVLATIYYFSPPAAGRVEPFVLLICGFAVFVAAMAFDASDRERLTRRADCAFWLHLLAAPLIVHSLIELVWPHPAGIARMAANLTTASAIAIALIFAVLATVAVIIDRRALLVSALTYFGIVIGYAITSTMGQQGLDSTAIFFITLGVLGALVVALGVGWQPMRRLLVGLLSPTVANRLPPAIAAPGA